MSEAAKCMGLTQSATTQQIRALADDIGFELFKKGSRPLSLTQEGVELYQNIAPILSNFESILENFLEIKDNKKNKEINIAAHHVAISHILPEVVNEFRKQDPESKIIFRNLTPAEAIRRLKNREIDLAFYPFYNFDPELEYIEIAQYKPVLIINKSHPLANHEIESLSDLKKYDFIRIDKNLITIPFFEETLNNNKLKGSIEFENGNWEMLINMVKKNDFVAVVSNLCVDVTKNDLLMKDLTKFFPTMKYSISHRGDCQIKNGLKNLIEGIKLFGEKSKL
jgi:LysR family transcriptional regulator for metE and metH